jgi:hypothetical protein
MHALPLHTSLRGFRQQHRTPFRINRIEQEATRNSKGDPNAKSMQSAPTPTETRIKE